MEENHKPISSGRLGTKFPLPMKKHNCLKTHPRSLGDIEQIKTNSHNSNIKL